MTRSDAPPAHVPIDVMQLSFVPPRPRLLVLSLSGGAPPSSAPSTTSTSTAETRPSPRSFPASTRSPSRPDYTHFGTALPSAIAHVAFEPVADITELHDVAPFAALTRITSLTIDI